MRPSGMTVSAAPHAHGGSSTRGLMGNQMLALLPTAAAGIFLFGMKAVTVILAALVVAAASELLMRKAMGEKVCLCDGHALLMGLMFAMMLPAGAPWWMVALGMAVAIMLPKWLYGGLGAYPFNPVLIAVAILQLSWPSIMSRWPAPVPVTAGAAGGMPIETPLEILRKYGMELAGQTSFVDMLLGNQGGSIGAVCAGAVILGGLYLVLRGIVPWLIPAGFIAGILAAGGAYSIIDPATYPCPLFHLLSGSTLLCVFFFSTDYTTSPNTKWGRLIYGLGCGCLTILIRVYGVYADGAPYAVLLMNLFTPMFDRIRPRVTGMVKEAAADA